MALHVQPYSPWREQMAMGFLGPLVNGIMERSRAANENRKYNALIGVMGNEMAPQMDTSMPVMQGMETPSLYGAEADPWAASARNGGYLQSFADAVNPQSMSRSLSVGDVLGRMNQHLTSKRFNMLDPAKAMQLMQPGLANFQAEEQKRQVQEFMNSFSFSGDPADIMTRLFQGGAMGYLDKSMVGDGATMLKHLNPHKTFEKVESGDKVSTYAFNPAQGTQTPLGSTPIGMNPYQAGSLANDRARVAQGWAEYARRASTKPNVMEAASSFVPEGSILDRINSGSYIDWRDGANDAKILSSEQYNFLKSQGVTDADLQKYGYTAQQ